VSAAPLFADYSRALATPDFRLQPGSPAIGKGLPPDEGDAVALRPRRQIDIGAVPYTDSEPTGGPAPGAQ
jgi:hypothetical protein